MEWFVTSQTKFFLQHTALMETVAAPEQNGQWANPLHAELGIKGISVRCTLHKGPMGRGQCNRVYST